MLAVHKAHLHGLLSHMPLSFKHVKLLSSVLGQSFERRGSVLERVHANVQIHNTMSQQRSLEDVGVKRTRQDADGGKDSKLTSNTQPPNKKTHTDSSDSKQNQISQVKGKPRFYIERTYQGQSAFQREGAQRIHAAEVRTGAL